MLDAVTADFAFWPSLAQVAPGARLSVGVDWAGGGP